MNTHPLNTYSTLTATRIADVVLACLMLLACLPLLTLSCLRSIWHGKRLTSSYTAIDCLNRPLTLTKLNSEPMPSLGHLFDILRGEISLCGLEILAANEAAENVSLDLQLKAFELRAGVFSLTALHKSSGLAAYDRKSLIAQHIQNPSISQYVLVTVKSFLTMALFSKTNLSSPEVFNLFGIRINNITMNEAIKWATAKRSTETTRLGVFVNVNSVNLSVAQPHLRDTINAADRVFADGSGVRLGAKHHGIALRDNVNGTDLLPQLCESAQRQSLSLFLLGAAPGIAELTAKNLQKQYPRLRIAGIHHGYFDKQGDDTQAVINTINQSGADILLTGFGSPIQETWLLENRDQLRAVTALAVGGLFDFFSGAIPRSPQWMRELGVEWVWRLLQDPATKWRRYVIGNPLFLFRLWFVCED